MIDMGNWGPLIWIILIVFVVQFLRRRRDWTSVPASSIYVVDGDTFHVLLNSGAWVKVRPIRYDAPEMDQKGGRMAAAAMRRLAKRGLYIRELSLDVYGRTLAEVRIGENGEGGDLARHMINAGLAHSVAESGAGRFIETLIPRLLGRGIWKNSWLGFTVTNPRIHRAAKAWSQRYRAD